MKWSGFLRMSQTRFTSAAKKGWAPWVAMITKNRSYRRYWTFACPACLRRVRVHFEMAIPYCRMILASTVAGSLWSGTRPVT